MYNSLDVAIESNLTAKKISNVSISNLSNGIYLINVVLKNRKTATLKFVKK